MQVARQSGLKIQFDHSFLIIHFYLRQRTLRYELHFFLITVKALPIKDYSG